jgi:hypothetical protein
VVLSKSGCCDVQWCGLDWRCWGWCKGLNWSEDTVGIRRGKGYLHKVSQFVRAQFHDLIVFEYFRDQDAVHMSKIQQTRSKH